MGQINAKHYKDLGRKEMVLDALPYDVVGDAYQGSFSNGETIYTALNHIVPAGKQLKLLFLRIWTEEAGGAVFSIYQTNPATAGLTGTVEAHPVVGSTPVGYRDWPMLEAPGAEILHGSLIDPIHVLEGSIDFAIHFAPDPSTGARYGIVWWGVEAIPDQEGS